MTLLEFARGPGFFWAFAILIAGIVLRIAALLLFRRREDLSTARDTNRVLGGLRTVAMRSVPPHELEKNIKFQHITGYAWHIGWFVTFLFLGSHMPRDPGHHRGDARHPGHAVRSPAVSSGPARHHRCG
jgi:hypothetical protein